MSLSILILPYFAKRLVVRPNRLQARNPRAADESLAGIRDTILPLGSMPEAHPIARESREFDLAVCRALYGKATGWHIYFAVTDGSVQVLHVRRGHRSDWQP